VFKSKFQRFYKLKKENTLIQRKSKISCSLNTFLEKLLHPSQSMQGEKASNPNTAAHLRNSWKRHAFGLLCTLQCLPVVTCMLCQWKMRS